MTKIVVNTPGVRGFFQWTKKAMPQLYQGMRKEFASASGVSGLRDTPWFAPSSYPIATNAPDPAATATTGAGSSSLANTIKEIANVAGQAYLTRQQAQAQQQILNVQLQRMQNGQSPLAIDPTMYGLPQPSIGVSLDESTKKLLMYGGGALVLAVLFGLIGGGRAARGR